MNWRDELELALADVPAHELPDALGEIEKQRALIWLRLQRKDPTPDREPEPVTPDLTVAEAARIVGRAESTVRTWLDAGMIPEAYKLNNRDWRIPQRALDHFLERQRNGETKKIGTGAKDAGELSAWRNHSPTNAGRREPMLRSRVQQVTATR